MSQLQWSFHYLLVPISCSQLLYNQLTILFLQSFLEYFKIRPSSNNYFFKRIACVCVWMLFVCKMTFLNLMMSHHNFFFSALFIFAIIPFSLWVSLFWGLRWIFLVMGFYNFYVIKKILLEIIWYKVFFIYL